MHPIKWTNDQVENFNQALTDLFGIDTSSGQAMWRIVWSDDEYEMRETQYTPEGLLLLSPVTRLLPKYKQYIQARYVLEHLVIVPESNKDELLGLKKSYEPIWTFEDKSGNYLPPHIEACKLIINTVIDAMALARDGRSKSKSFRKYYDEEYSQEASIEAKRKRVDEITEYLFGEQSGLAGTTVNCGETIIVPKNFESK